MRIFLLLVCLFFFQPSFAFIDPSRICSGSDGYTLSISMKDITQQCEKGDLLLVHTSLIGGVCDFKEQIIFVEAKEAYCTYRGEIRESRIKVKVGQTEEAKLTLSTHRVEDNLPPSENEIIGIDVSKYQKEVDFKKVKDAGVSYVFIRATDGITYQDPNFKTNFSSAQDVGIIVGAYHFYQTNDDPNAQLENFINTVSLKTGDLPPVVDIEKLHKQEATDLTENLQTFLDGLEKHYGVKPIIYTGLNFSNKYLTKFGDYPLWIAEYEKSKPQLPAGWDVWTFWQWSQTHTISGVSGYVDADRYIGDKTSFLNMLIK